MNYARPGTVIHGTLRTEDLLRSFADELEDLVRANTDEWRSDRGHDVRDSYLGLVWEAREAAKTDGDHPVDVLDELCEALELFAPDGHYFGSHPGDGSDFGFWLTEDINV